MWKLFVKINLKILSKGVNRTDQRESLASSSGQEEMMRRKDPSRLDVLKLATDLKERHKY